MSNLQRIIWLASFPKSGNTWARIFLANYFQPPGRGLDINELYKFTTSDIRQDFFDRAAGRPFKAETIEDWLSIRPKALRLIAESKPTPHFVKTHCQIMRLRGSDLIPPDLTAAAVCIIRNPFDIAGSYARHLGADIDAGIFRLTDHLGIYSSETNISEMVGRWDDHVRSWTMAPGLARHVMRYEDMTADPAGEFGKLLDFLLVPVDETQLSAALERASFKALQIQEKSQGFRERPAKMEKFFAKGRSGGWRSELTPAQVARLRIEFLPELKKWYPEMLEETESFAAGSN